MPTWDLLQNPSFCLLLLYLFLCLPRCFNSSSSVLFCNLWQCALLVHIYNTSYCSSLSLAFSNLLPYVHINHNWNTWVSCPRSSLLISQCLWVIFVLHIWFLFLSCNHVFLLWTHIPIKLMLLPLSTLWVSLKLLSVDIPVLSWLCLIIYSSLIKNCM